MSVKLRVDLLECEKKALALLEHNKITEATLVRVGPGEILFTHGPEGKGTAWTAWTDEKSGELLRLDQGFVADY